MPSHDEAPISQFHLSGDMEKLAWEARARITWGEGAEDVKRWLLASGGDEETAQRIVMTCLRERARSVRLKGLRDLLLGSGLLAVAAGVAYFLRQIPLPRAWAACYLAFFLGFTLAARGVYRLLWGARIRGADSDQNDLWW